MLTILRRTKNLLLNILIKDISYIFLKRQLYWSNYFSMKFNYTIQYGLFTGMKFSKKLWWGKSDLTSMYFGFYEQQILNILSNYKNSKYKYFIDIGAANGYYAVGVLFSKIFTFSYAFEISKTGQSVIENLAKLNNVNDSIQIFGECNSISLFNLNKNILNQSFILIDIEGAEFDLLNESMLCFLCNSVILIELHEFFFDNGLNKVSNLINIANKYFIINKIISSERNPNIYKELENINDDDKWLLCSERRKKSMTWLLLEPK